MPLYISWYPQSGGNDDRYAMCGDGIKQQHMSSNRYATLYATPNAYNTGCVIGGLHTCSISGGLHDRGPQAAQHGGA